MLDAPKRMPPHQQLEVAWAEANGLDPAGMVACSSGTAALHLALEAIRSHDSSVKRVGVPNYSMVAPARAVAMAGMEVVPLPCSYDDRLLSTSIGWVDLDVLLSVSTYGRVPDMSDCKDSAGSPWVVEDLAEAHFQPVHAETDAACWSFYRNKVIAGEEGGAVWFRDPDLAKRARVLRSLGFEDGWTYNHVPRGHNYRLADSLASLVLRELQYADMIREAFAKTWGDYRDVLVGHEAIYVPAMPDHPWVFDLSVKGASRSQVLGLCSELRDVFGVAARPGFVPLNRQPEFERDETPGDESARVSEETMYLPLKPDPMCVGGVDRRVVSLIKRFADRFVRP